MNFLFWNTARKDLSVEVADLAAETASQVVILAEASDYAANYLSALNESETQHLPFRASAQVPDSDRILLIGSLPANEVVLKASDNTCSVYELKPSGEPSVLLACLHLPSPIHFDEIDRASNAACTARMIAEEEERAGHCRTLVIGDFNMNPFEPGMVGVSGFHAILDRRIAEKGSRKVQGRKHPFFYNPMWRFMNDTRSPACGSHYYAKSKPVCHYWNTFDQVLLRPELLPAFDDSGIQIIETIGQDSLLDAKGRPDKLNQSDHLPVFLTLDLQKL